MSIEVKTKTMGNISVEDNQILNFPHGLYGFEETTRFALVPSENEPFQWLQSLEDENLSFLVIDPFFFCPDYELNIDDASLEAIKIFSPSDVIVLSIVTLPSDGGPVTANLQGPLIINKNNRLSMQTIANDPRWQTKHDIVAELKKREAVC